LPLFQRRNFELAREAVDFVLDRDNHPPLHTDAELLAAHTSIPARMEVHHYAGKTVILDGSHNPQKLGALAQSIRAAYPHMSVAALVGFARSSTVEQRTSEGTAALLPALQHLIITSFIVNRAVPHGSADPEDVARTCRTAGFDAYEVITDPEQAFSALLERPEPVFLVTGSFFLLNVIRPLLQAAQ
jgi:dihydrofolate synthase/folylpolyglutamate synthase